MIYTSNIVSPSGIRVGSPPLLTLHNDSIISTDAIITAGEKVIRSDGNTVTWCDSRELSTVIKDNTNLVFAWADKLGTDRGFRNDGRATYSATNGITFDGVTQYLRTPTYTLAQPTFIYMVVQQPSWVSSKYIFDGFYTNSGMLVKTGTTPQIVAGAGSNSGVNVNLTVGVWHIVRVLFNGASSKLIVDTTSAVTFSCGAGAMSGMTLSRPGASSSAFGNNYIKEVIIRSVSDSAGNEAAIYSYLSNKYL
jgi:hypothetical protein